MFSVWRICNFSSFCFTSFRIWETSLIGESISLRLSYFPDSSIICFFISWFSTFKGSNKVNFSLRSRISSLKFSIMESFCLANFLIWETSFIGESISLRLSYLWLISLKLSLSKSFSEAKSWRFFNLINKSWFSFLRIWLSASIFFNSFLVCEISLTGESISLRLSYLLRTSTNSLFNASFSTSKTLSFSFNSEIVLL